MSFTALDVKNLREKTGCGMMDCKKALTETDGDTEKAVEFLREKGLAAAAKKAGRIAADGFVDCFVDGNVGGIIEVNSETDFVAKNVDFQNFVRACVVTVVKNNPSSLEELLEMQLDGANVTVAEAVHEKVLTIGENITIRRFVRAEGSIVTYIHGGGRIGVMMNFDTNVATNESFITLAKDLCMQIAAMNPLYLKEDEVPAEVIEKEKEILIAQIKEDPKNASKPDNILEKMVFGKIRKYYENNCLLDQVFVKDNAVKVLAHINAVAKEVGGNITVKSFTRFEKGEGIQKRVDDFAGEIASMVK
ncbi:MAG: translation elongation factor Ts [Clostridia bacterium]